MPGTIQVSVLELMDLPPSTDLKVSMGKKEYQTMGKGDFSFPVVSLRENLILMLHDKEGNVVSRTEFKTMSVVEKGTWDDMFPLEGGGRVRMKLQFLLSEEERQRIREVRDSALRRKHEVVLKHGLESSISGQKFGGSIPFPRTELVCTEALINQSEQTQMNVENPSSTASFQNLGEGSGDSFEQVVRHLTEVPKETIEIQSPPDDTHKGCISSEEFLNPHMRRSRSLVLGNDGEVVPSAFVEPEKNQIRSPERMDLPQRSLSSNVRKMISAFENITSQGAGPHVDLRTRDRVSTIQVKSLQTMPKSFSTGMLSDINFQINPKFFRSPAVKKQEDMVNFKNMESGRQKAVRVKDFVGLSWDALHIAQSSSPKGTNTVLRTTETEVAASERENPVRIEAEQGPPIISMHTDFDAFEDKKELDVSTRGDCRADEGIGISEQIVANYLQLYHDVNSELVHEEENGIDCTSLEEDQPSREMHAETMNIDEACSPCTYEHGSTYSDYERCPFRSLGIWIPRYLCVTTGSKQLRNLVGCCNICVRTQIVEKTPPGQ